MAKTKTPPTPRCEWTLIAEEGYADGYYKTDCGNGLVLNDGGPKEHGMIYCPFCGRRLRERTATKA